MGRFFVLLVSFAACACSLAAKNSPVGAAIYISASSPVTASNASAGVMVADGTWMKKTRANGVSALMPTSQKWKTMSFAFTPSADGEAEIILRNKFFRDEDGVVSSNRALFRAVRVDGALLPDGDFRGGAKGWALRKGAAVHSAGGVYYLSASYESCGSLKISVKKGVKTTVSALVKDGGMPSSVDLSKFANTSFGADGSDGEFAPVKSLEDAVERKISSIAFRFPSEGKQVVTLASTRFPKLYEIEIDLSESPVREKCMYILHSSGKNLRKGNKMGNIGGIEVVYEDGSASMIWVKRAADAPDGYKKLLGENAIPAVSDENGGTLYLSRFPIEDKTVKKLVIKGAGYAAWNIAGITFSPKNVETTQYYEFNPAEWRPIDLSDLEVKDGSALDVSAHMGDAPAGKYGRLIINTEGKFAFEKRPNDPVRFKGTNWRPGDQFLKTINTREDIDILAKMARKQGYNMIRWRLSMRGGAEFAAPYQMRPEVLDMYDYFLYAMAREGVYTHLNLSSHDLGQDGFLWKDRYSVKLQMLLGDKPTREAWRKLVAMQLNHVNPYTGLKWKDDPAIATTEYFNEMELGFSSMRSISAPVAEYANAEFIKWLKRKYPDIAALNKAWEVNRKKTSWNSFDEIKVFGDYSVRENHDLSLFIMEKGREFMAYCENAVRTEEKFTAPLHQFNCNRRIDIEYLSAIGGSYMALNVYFAHPTDFNSVDSSAPQESSLCDKSLLGYFLGAASKRMADRPMALTEWQHCHWNPYKHEAGVTFPALSALQGFDNLTVHDYAIEKHGKGIFGHAEVSKNPIMRANEFLSYCFFFRGDVKKSPHRVDVVFDEKFVSEDPAMAYAMNREQSRISLLTGFAIDFAGARKISDLAGVKVRKPDVKLRPVGFSAAVSALNFTETGAAAGEKFSLENAVKDFRAKGILPEGNITDIAKGVFQSDTGEITIRTDEEFAKVVTANSEAAAIKTATTNEKLGVLTVKSTSVPASAAVASVDGKPLAKSSRMVFIYATDSIATDFKVSQSRVKMKSRGKPPILVQVGKISAELKLPEAAKGVYALYALDLTGARVEKIPAKVRNGAMLIEIDTAKLSKEPATFYEIVAE